MALGKGTNRSIRRTEIPHVQKPSINATRLRAKILSPNGRIGIRRGRRTLAGGRKITITLKTSETNSTPQWLLLSHVHPTRKELRHLRKGTASRDEIPWTLEAISRLDKRTIHNPH